MATQILFDGKHAVGVRYVVDGTEREAGANASVILSAGAVQSPQLLELSGIGDPDILRKHGMGVVHPLRGVGENYRDHYAARINWRVRHPITLNEWTRGWRLVRETFRYLFSRRGVLTFTAGIGHGFVRTRPELETPDVQLFFAHASFASATTRELECEPGMTIGGYQCRPESRGSIHLRCADPLAPPAIRPNFLAERLDRDTLVAGLRICRRLGEAKAFAPYRERENSPGTECDTDEALLEHARRTGATTYHPMGTCKMGADPMAVVDERLRVHGLDGLRVVDASIMPTMPSGNINAAVIMVAEKASDLIIEDQVDLARRAEEILELKPFWDATQTMRQHLFEKIDALSVTDIETLRTLKMQLHAMREFRRLLQTQVGDGKRAQAQLENARKNAERANRGR